MMNDKLRIEIFNERNINSHYYALVQYLIFSAHYLASSIQLLVPSLHQLSYIIKYPAQQTCEHNACCTNDHAKTCLPVHA